MDASAVELEVELWIKGYGAYGEWGVPSVTVGEPEPERRVRVAPIHFKWTRELGATEESQFEAYMNAFDAVGERGVDLVVFGECMYGRGLNWSHEYKATVTEPRMKKAIAEKAKQYNTYAIYDGVESDGVNYYNSAFLYDRSGELVGTYRKTHITVGEYERGLTPGNSFPVFDTDFGRVGILICYDQFFPKTALELAQRGAEIICIPTAGDDHHACMGMAMSAGVYLAVAGMNTENSFGFLPTRLVDPLGRILAHTDVNGEAAYGEIDLSKRVRRHWMSTGPALSCVHDDYRYEINTHCYE
jgi:predicted amidohydrolase